MMVINISVIMFLVFQRWYGRQHITYCLISHDLIWFYLCYCVIVLLCYFQCMCSLLTCYYSQTITIDLVSVHSVINIISYEMSILLCFVTSSFLLALHSMQENTIYERIRKKWISSIFSYMKYIYLFSFSMQLCVILLLLLFCSV